MALETGSRLGVYQILAPLGRGGMGEVYRAHDARLGRDVAIKVLRGELSSDPERLKRFEQEARAASALNHPNIVHIYDIGEQAGTRYIAMEYVDGRTLRELIGGSPLPPARLVELASQIAEGLVKAHAAGIVHRDLKPDNLMVSQDGFVKILDFGLAKLLPDATQVESELATRERLETREGLVLGTVHYMSPEQARGEKVDFRSDQFSFGAILYEMATGTMAFARGSMVQTMAAILESEPEPLLKLNPGAPAALNAVVERCLRKDPGERYDSTRALAEDLKAVPEGSPGRRARRSFFWAAAGLLSLLLALVLGLDFEHRPGADSTAGSIAVLPLRNVSGDPDEDYFADGMTEALIADLARIGALKVISRTSVMTYKGSGKTLKEIASELDVDNVLEGSALRVGDRVRITTQLIDAASDRHLWAETYERDFGDLLVLQSEIARTVAREIEVALTPEETTRLAGARAVDPEAHEAVLRGRFHVEKLTPADIETALSYFELAREKDPSYAPAYVGIANVWGGRAQMGFVPARVANPRAKAAVLRALELDDSLPEAHHMLAAMETWGEWNWPAAERAFERAIELNPSDPDARRSYSHFLNNTGRPKEAMAQIERASELDPFNALTHAFYGVNLLYVRRYDDAILRFRQALETSPNLPFARQSLGAALHLNGMYDEALAEERSFREAIGDREGTEALNRGFAEGGYEGALRRLAESSAARSLATETGASRVARLYLRAGDNESALEWLERAYGNHDPGLPYLGLPIYDGVRDEPRFRDLLRRMKLPL